jgi:TetR/AcrR family transcriptional regulator, transcriptional repressor for nem operon
MRYSRDHKQTTRRRIVAAASAAFRERGVDGTGVDEVMRRAGLTHGGFYAHFHSKLELLAEACADAFDAALDNLERIAGQSTPARRARVLIDSYLSLHHRDNPGSGCLIVAVGADMARFNGAGRAGYARGFERHLDRLCDALRLSEDPVRNRDRVNHLMSALVGALLFARAVDDPPRSAALLLSARRTLREEFCQ